MSRKVVQTERSGRRDHCEPSQLFDPASQERKPWTRAG